MFFGQWAAEFDEVEVPSDLDGFTAAVGLLDRYTAELTLALVAFHELGAWDYDGSVSSVGWLQERGLTAADASRLVAMAKKLRRWPVLADAWRAGRVSGGQVQAVCAQVIERHVELFASHETELVPTFSGLSVGQTARAMSSWRAKADALDDGRPPRDEPCEERLSTTLDDRGLLTASLDAEGVALATAAFDVAGSHDLDVPLAQRRGQALKDIFRFVLDHHAKPAGRKRPHLNIVIDEATLHTDSLEGFDAEAGVRLGSLTLERLLCDCELHRVIRSTEGALLDYGRAAKTPPVDLYNAVVIRDQGCRWKKCNRPAAWCHALHVKWWKRDQGPTSIYNLVLLCAKHHGMVHRKGWRAELRPNGDFIVTTPWGETRSTSPPGAQPKLKLKWGDGEQWCRQDELDLDQLIRARVRELVNA